MIGWIVIITTELFTIFLWYLAKQSNPISSVELALVQILGLTGIVSLAWTYVIATRVKIIEKMFGGLDIAYKAHHILGASALVALINHSVLLMIDSMPANTIRLYLIPGSSLAYNLGIYALYLMLLLVILTLYVKLPYRYWKWSHEWMGIVIILGGLHSMLITSDTSLYMPLRYWILAVSIIATISYLYKRFIYYFVGSSKYKIIKSGRQQDLLVISMESIGSPIQFGPGQYGFFSLQKNRRNDHAFSILGSDNKKVIIGVKVVGDFTNQLSQLAPDTEVIMRGPYGTFGDKMKNTKHAVWIAGGIGITPFLSMAKAVKSEQRVEMYFCARVLPPSVITTPFANLAERNSRFVWLPCETTKGGRLTARKIFDDTGCDKYATYMLCGPKEMMESLAEQLAEIGISRSRIIYEDFAFK